MSKQIKTSPKQRRPTKLHRTGAQRIYNCCVELTYVATFAWDVREHTFHRQDRLTPPVRSSVQQSYHPLRTIPTKKTTRYTKRFHIVLNHHNSILLYGSTLFSFPSYRQTCWLIVYAETSQHNESLHFRPSTRVTYSCEPVRLYLVTAHRMTVTPNSCQG